MKITVRYFNMVELALAMAVLAIGISSILVLFPVGINASTNARANDQVPMVADMVLETIKSTVYKLTDWSAWTAGIPTSMPTIVDEGNGASEYKVDSSPVQDGWSLYGTNRAGIYAYKNDDFNAYIRFWRDSTNYYQEFKIGSVGLADTDQAALNKVAAVIYVEISWPADVPYPARVEAGNVRTYRLELFNQEAQ